MQRSEQVWDEDALSPSPLQGEVQVVNGAGEWGREREVLLERKVEERR